MTEKTSRGRYNYAPRKAGSSARLSVPLDAGSTYGTGRTGSRSGFVARIRGWEGANRRGSSEEKERSDQ